MRFFRWISARPLPAAHDLRARGWRLRGGADDEAASDCALLVDGARSAALAELAPPQRRRALALGVGDSAARVRWLEAGFADALPPGVELDELALRAARLVGEPGAATTRSLGPLALDLVARDARAGGRRLRLNPREFALLWRLAEAGGEAVPRSVLLRDVWGLAFEPGTNSVAVHVCRLRKKLDTAGLAALVVTGPGDAGYRLFVDDHPARNPLDAPGRLREHRRVLEEIAP